VERSKGLIALVNGTKRYISIGGGHGVGVSFYSGADIDQTSPEPHSPDPSDLT
jgi:hypothetical protein